MLIKAGTYRFNDVLTEGVFEQDINFTTTATDDNTTGTWYASKITGDIVYGVFLLIEYVYKTVICEGDEEIVEEIEEPMPAGIYGRGGWQDSVFQLHTITEDTEVSDDFGTWYMANTKAVNTTKKFTRLYLGATVCSGNGKKIRKLQTTTSEGLACT